MAKITIFIRPALADDAEIICDIRDRTRIAAYTNKSLGITSEQIRINCQGRDGEFVPRRVAYLRELLSKNIGVGFTILVAIINDQVVGYVDPEISENDRRFIGGMYVLPEFQGTGVGSMLLKEALNQLGRDQDIYLEVVAYNQNAIHFYEKFGFIMTDTVVSEDEDKPSYVTSLPQFEMVLKSQS